MSYVPNTPDETKAMLESIGFADFEELFSSVPAEVRLQRGLNVGDGLSEIELAEKMKGIAAKNKVYEHVFRGAGAYKHFIPAMVDSLTSRGEFVTAYTPYQAEMSQGILQGIFEYQTMICTLTGMDVANASVYDGATAAGEACFMVRERNKHKMLVSGAADPQIVETMKTYAEPAGIKIEMLNEKNGSTDLGDLLSKLSPDVAGVFISQPNYFGIIEPAAEIADAVHAAKAKLVMGVNPISLGILKTPADCGADIAVGEGQPLGLPLAFGGPYLGFMACTKENMRKLPGRIVGETVDVHGRRAFVLTLQAREQHIRREKAGSNICSNEAWCALRSAVYMSAMGKAGLWEVARHCYANAHYLQEKLSAIGFLPIYKQQFFHEFVTTCPIEPLVLQKILNSYNILGGLPLGDNRILWCATELNGKQSVDALVHILREALENER